MPAVLCPAILSSDNASDPGRRDLLRARRRFCGSECCSCNSNAPDTSQKGLIGIQSHHSRGKMAKKAREKPAEAGSASVFPLRLRARLWTRDVTAQPPDHGSLAGVPYLVYRTLEEVIYNSAEPQHSMTDPRQPASATWTKALAMVKAVLQSARLWRLLVSPLCIAYDTGLNVLCVMS